VTEKLALLNPPAAGDLRRSVPGSDSPGRVLEAARDFEALLIGQLLKGMLDESEDAAGAISMDLGYEHFAQALASQGGLGLARLVAQGLEKP